MTKKASRLISGRYLSCSLLCCRFIPSHEVVVVTATDGHVAFFKLPPISKDTVENSWSFISRFQIHQSSVKCLEIVAISGIHLVFVALIQDYVVRILTGGDDNAVHLLEVTFRETIICNVVASVSDAHTSTVTGVVSLGNSRFLSVGIDQCLRVWEFDGKGLVSLQKAYTFVADVCGIVDINVREERKRRFVAFGTGMELISWVI